jgi:DNA polymerase-3 subunit delta'
MFYDEIIGHESLKKHLQFSVENGRIPHAQIFSGDPGSGTLFMALAYAQHILASHLVPGTEAYRQNILKSQHLTHPDLHFVFPVATNQEVKSKPMSDLFLPAWRKFVTETPYGSAYDWFMQIGIENKQGFIGVDEAQDIIRKLNLKSFEGGYKVMLIWMAEKMNTETANKLLKVIEEPTDRTVLMLVCEDAAQLLQTIQSRCQLVEIPRMAEAVIEKALIEKYGLKNFEATQIARKAEGDFHKALQLLTPSDEDIYFETLFIRWVRLAFSAKGNKTAILDLLKWAEEVASKGRETQKNFLKYCVEVFRQAILLNQNCKGLVFFESKDAKFDINKFAPFVHPENVFGIFESIKEASLHIERNGNAKIVLTDLSIKLTRLLHQKNRSA